MCWPDGNCPDEVIEEPGQGSRRRLLNFQRQLLMSNESTNNDSFIWNGNSSSLNYTDTPMFIDISNDFHSRDTQWYLSWNESGNGSSTSTISGTESEVILDDFLDSISCFNFTMTDSFGDGLQYGQGDWSLSWANFTWISPTSGDYGSFESIQFCHPLI